VPNTIARVAILVSNLPCLSCRGLCCSGNAKKVGRGLTGQEAGPCCTGWNEIFGMRSKAAQLVRMAKPRPVRLAPSNQLASFFQPIRDGWGQISLHLPADIHADVANGK
jgi:hypothetical protein